MRAPLLSLAWVGMFSSRRWKRGILDAAALQAAVEVSEVNASAMQDDVQASSQVMHPCLGSKTLRQRASVSTATASEAKARPRTWVPRSANSTEHAGRGGQQGWSAAQTARAGPRPKASPRWGRCMVCQRALIVKVRHADGNPFLSCPRWPACTYATSVPQDKEHLLADVYVTRHRVDF